MIARNPARLLAPLAIAATALAIFLVVRSETAEPSADTSSPPAATSTPAAGDGASTSGDGEGRRSGDGEGGGSGGSSSRPRTYTVKPGDVLSAIAEETGVPLSRLQELNPNVDPQALRSGQKLKLRG